jgi:hypothetical protein
VGSISRRVLNGTNVKEREEGRGTRMTIGESNKSNVGEDMEADKDTKLYIANEDTSR